jgi:hypothetical protein
MTTFTRLLTVTLGIVASLPGTSHADPMQDCLNTSNYYFVAQMAHPSSGAGGRFCLDRADGVFSFLNEASLLQLLSVDELTGSVYNSFSVNIIYDNTLVYISNNRIIEGVETNTGSALGFGVQGESGSNRVFDGGTINESLRMIIKFLRHDEKFMRAQAQYLAEKTPDSSITGPNGLIPSTVAVEFDSAVENTLNEIAVNSLDSAGLESTLVNFSASTGHITVAGKTADITTLPLSYTWRSNTDKGRMFSLSGSLARISATHDTTNQFGLGVTYRLPVTERWALTPSLRYSGTQSDDLASSIGLVTAGLSSTYHIPYKKLSLIIGNALGYHRTTDIIDLGKYSFDPEIKSWSARNGLTLAQPVNFFNVPLSVEYSVADTRYFGGTDFYVDNTQEVGLSIGTNRRADVTKKYLRFGLRYLHGRETHGLSVTGGYWF